MATNYSISRSKTTLHQKKQQREAREQLMKETLSNVRKIGATAASKNENKQEKESISAGAKSSE